MKARVAWMCAGALALAGACAGGAAEPNEVESSAQALKYDGEMLYRGFFFRDGPAAAAFDAALSSIDEEREATEFLETQAAESAESLTKLRDQRATAIDGFVAAVRARDAQHFDGFAKAVYSGDRAALAKRLDEEAALIQELSGSEVGEDLKSSDIKAVTNFQLAVETFVIYEQWIAINTIKAWTHIISYGADEGALQRELVVDAIATHFGR
jgi:SdpC family antimicrobial peptide